MGRVIIKSVSKLTPEMKMILLTKKDGSKTGLEITRVNLDKALKALC